MASSSSASNSQYCPRWKYDVFLSFRGDDTRNNFMSHLYKNLKNRRIFTFLDDERLEDGDSISEELVQAIEESQVAVIVFSKNYATSRWCLNELVKIMECKEKENGQTVIPVFYYVDPSHVRYQIESFAEAFAKHESRYKDNVEGMQKVQGWRNALTAAADLKGHDIDDRINQSMKIDQIVDHISSKLCKSASLSNLQDVVGINAHLEKLTSLLQIEINNVRIVGIWGTGGIGKTTIATTIFDNLSDQFDAACFLGDVKEKARENQLHSLQNILLSKLLRKKDDYVDNKYAGKSMIKRRLCSMKVLIVLDDIDHGDHLEYLAGDVDWFGNGSRVILTTRNRKLIENNDAIYEVPTLPDHEAMQLFNQHAFKKEVPDECFKNFSLEVVNYAKGLPLALKVWGSMLHKKGVDKWKKIVDKIKKKSNLEIVEKLKISYDGLEREEQKVFLDIICFFRCHRREEVIHIVESYYSGAEDILDVLIDKSLVFITRYNRVEMHDLIQDMGKYIVKMQKDSGNCSRIWNVEDFEDVMMNNMQFLSLRRIDLSYSFRLKRTPDFKGMPNLEYLNLKYCRSLEEVHPSLKYCKKLIELNLDECKSLERFLYVNVESLRILELECCSCLKKCPEILGIMKPELEINMSCSGIRELPLSYFDLQPHLTMLYLRGMDNLVSLPSSICKLKGLVSITVSFCVKLESLPEEIGDLENLQELDASYTLISRPPSSIIRLNKLKSLTFEKEKSEDRVFFVFPQVNEGLSSLEILILSNCNLIIPEDIGSLSSLKSLDLSYCNIIDGGLPEDIGSLSSLKVLLLRGNEFEHLPRSIFQLGALEFLDLSNCKRLTQLPEDIGSLSSLKVLLLRGNEFEHLPRSIFQLGALEYLDLSNCKRLTQLPEDIGCLSTLKYLNLSGNNFEHLPRSIFQLGALEYLHLSDCKRLTQLPEDIGCLSSLKELYLKGNNFEHLPQSISELGALRLLELSDCKRLTQLPEFPQQLHTIGADWSNDLICNMLFQNISLLQHDISVSDSLSLRVFKSMVGTWNTPSWFNYQGMGTSVSVALPENWYVSDKFLGFAVCYSGKLIDDITAHLIPLSCDDGMSSMTQQFALSNNRHYGINFFLIPLGGLWDASNANGKTPNDYGCFRLYFSTEIGKYGVRLFYKDEAELHIGIRKSRYEEEATCSSSKKQRQLFPRRFGL